MYISRSQSILSNGSRYSVILFVSLFCDDMLLDFCHLRTSSFPAWFTGKEIQSSVMTSSEKVFVFYFIVLVCSSSAVKSSCITSEHLNSSHLVFDNDTKTCERLDITEGVVSIKLEVEASCVNTREVRISK